MASSSSRFRLVASYSTVLLASKAMVLGASYVFALHLSNEDFGYVALAQAVFLAAISAFGLNAQAAYVRYCHEHGARDVLHALGPAYGLLGALALTAGLGTYLLFDTHPHYRWFALLPAAGFLASHLASLSAVARTTNSLGRYLAAEAGRPAIFLALALLFVIAQPQISPAAFFACALLLATGLALAVSLASLRSSTAPRGGLSSKIVLRYLLPLVVVQVVALLNNVGDRFFLAAWVPIAELGVYGKAYLIGSTLGMLFDSISVLWGPYVVRHRHQYARNLHPLMRRGLALVALMSVALLMLAVWIWASGTDQVAGVDAEFVVVAVVVTSAFVARIGYQLCVPVLCAFDRTGVVAKLSMLSAAVGLILNAGLIPWFGMHGAACATWASFLVFSVGAYREVAIVCRPP